MTEFIQNIDWTVLNFIQENLICPFMNFLMPAVSFLGNGGMLFIALGVIMLFFRQYRRCGANVLLCLLLGLVVASLLLKPLVARERPCWLNEDIELLIAVPRDYSFPSGHTLHSVMTAAVVCFYDKRIGIPLAVLAAAMAFSRLYLYVHFPSDVLCGAAFGIAIAFGGVYLLRFICRKSESAARLLPDKQ